MENSPWAPGESNSKDSGCVSTVRAQGKEHDSSVAGEGQRLRQRPRESKCACNSKANRISSRIQCELQKKANNLMASGLGKGEGQWRLSLQTQKLFSRYQIQLFRNSTSISDLKLKRQKQNNCFFYSPFADWIMFPDFWTSSNFVKITFNLYEKSTHICKDCQQSLFTVNYIKTLM